MFGLLNFTGSTRNQPIVSLGAEMVSVLASLLTEGKTLPQRSLTIQAKLRQMKHFSILCIISLSPVHDVLASDQDAKKALVKSEEEVRRTSESIQRLEEELEVADARWKAAQGQLAAAERRERRCARCPSDAIAQLTKAPLHCV